MQFVFFQHLVGWWLDDLWFLWVKMNWIWWHLLQIMITSDLLSLSLREWCLWWTWPCKRKPTKFLPMEKHRPLGFTVQRLNRFYGVLVSLLLGHFDSHVGQSVWWLKRPVIERSQEIKANQTGIPRSKNAFHLLLSLSCGSWFLLRKEGITSICILNDQVKLWIFCFWAHSSYKSFPILQRMYLITFLDKIHWILITFLLGSQHCTQWN